MVTARGVRRCGWLGPAASLVSVAAVLASAVYCGVAVQAAPAELTPHALHAAHGFTVEKTDESQQCFYTFPDCTSTDPVAGFSLTVPADTTGCKYQESVDWGDDTPADTQTFSGGAANTILVTFSHTYVDKPGTYSITVLGQTLAGSCPAFSGTFEFTLAALCSEQNPAVCLQAANAVAGLDTGAEIEAPAGLTVLTSGSDQRPDIEVKPADGFAAAALTDTTGDVILIADEGARLVPPTSRATSYDNGSFAALARLFKGHAPSALADAVQFAQSVQASNPSAAVYVTGFDLGGVEAQAQAQALGSGVAEGITFGAPGLPGNSMTGSPATVVNFVDYGDSVGAWASDPGGDLAAIVPAGLDHYGIVAQVGSPASEFLPRLAKNTYRLAVDNAVDQAVGKQWGAGDAFDRLLKLFPSPYTLVVRAYDYSVTGFSYLYLGGTGLLYHSIGQYASDLGVSLAQTVAPAASLAEYDKLFNPTASPAAQQAAGASTVSADGTVAGPGYNLTADAATDEPASQTYTTTLGTQYDVSYDPAAQVSSLKVNDPGGTSYVIVNDDSGQYAWSTRVDFYSGPDQTGTRLGTLYNWTVGGSQLLIFTGLPKGDTEEVLNYSQPDTTGTLLSRQYQ